MYSSSFHPLICLSHRFKGYLSTHSAFPYNDLCKRIFNPIPHAFPVHLLVDFFFIYSRVNGPFIQLFLIMISTAIFLYPISCIISIHLFDDFFFPLIQLFLIMNDLYKHFFSSNFLHIFHSFIQHLSSN